MSEIEGYTIEISGGESYLIEEGFLGDSGLSAYEVARLNGFVGTESQWLASLKGDKGDTATVQIGTVSSVPFPGPPTVTNVGTNEDAILDFGLVTGEKGNTGDAATIQVGTTQTLAPGSAATVTNSGTSGAAILNFGIPQGLVGPMGEVSTAQLNAAIALALQPLRPVVVNQPTGVSGNVGDSLALSCLGGILPNTHLNLTYQWQFSTDAGVSYTNISGATSATLPFTPALVGNNGLYRCRLTNAFGSQDTNAVSIAIDGSIQHLYGVNDRGIAWDLDRMDHLFQLSNGTIPVAAYGDPVGLILTRERGGQDNLGTNVSTVTSVTGLPIGSSATNIYNLGSTIVNRMYLITFEVTNYSGTGTVGFTGSATDSFFPTPIVVSANGSYSARQIANGTDLRLFTRSTNTCNFENISIREIPGTHLIQTNSLRRSTYARRPKSGIRNLARFTEQFENVYWTKTGATIDVNADTDPNGGSTADFLKETTANSNHLVFLTTPVLSGVHTFSFWVKPQGRNRINVISSNQAVIPLNINLDLVDGFTAAGATVTDAGNGWLKVVTVTGVCSGSNGINIRLRDTAGATTYVGDGSSGVLLWGAQLEAGSVATAYQRVGNQFDVTETGQPSINYLWFDGIDDCMQSATAIDFSNSDEMTVSVGQRKLRTMGTASAVIGITDDPLNTNGSFEIQSPGALHEYLYSSRGSVRRIATTVSFPQPDLGLLTGQANISDDVLTLRRNGTQIASSTDDQGTGNYANAVLHLGSRAGSSLFFSGHINSGFIINKILNPLVLADYEKYWVGAKAGIDLP